MRAAVQRMRRAAPMTTFALTMPAPRTPYQWRQDSLDCWHGITATELARILERWCAYPDEVRADVDQGRVVAIDGNGARPMHVRRRPTAAEEQDVARQIGLGL